MPTDSSRGGPQGPVLQRGLRLGDATVDQVVKGDLETRLQELATTLNLDDARVVVRVGRPPLEVVREVVDGGHDLVIVVSDGHDESAAVVRRLIRLCPCPVWVLRSRFTGTRVLAAVDPDDDPGLNRLILELASSQASRYDGDLHVVHAWEPYGHGAMTAGEFQPASPALVTSLVEEAERLHRQAFDDLLADAAWTIRRALISWTGRRSRRSTA